MKGIVFAGCSNTWGHGLWYYSGLDNIPYGDENLNYQIEKSSYMNFKNIIRYPRLVANHFNTYDVVKFTTAGTDEVSLRFLELLFSDNKDFFNTRWITEERYTYDEIEYVIFQTTFPDRSSIYIERNGKTYGLSLSGHNNWNEYVKTLTDFGIESFEQFYSLLINQLIGKIKSAFEFYESKGIKCRIYSWTKDYVDLIKSDEFLSQRFITFEHQGKKYECAQQIIEDYPHYQIKFDYESFGENPPNDYHPSDKMHKVIAENIIRFIENQRIIK
jgi:hypothetical protein